MLLTVSRIATTPWPPAAQIEIRPRPSPRSASAFASEATIRPPVAANGCPAPSEPPFTFSFERSISPSGASRPEALLAEDRVLPRLERAEHLGGERLVDLVEIEVLEGQAVSLEHPRHRVGGRHQEALLLADVVDRGDLGVDEARLRRDAVRRRPLLGAEKDGGGAVGERGRVAGGHRAALAAEDGLELAQALGGRVGPQVAVALEAQIRGHEVIHEAAVVSGRQVLVARRGKLVLLLALEAPLLRHERGVLAHRKAGARLGVAREVGDDLARADLRERLDAVGRRTGGVRLEQDLAQVVVERDRRVRGGVGAAGDRRVGLAQRDLVGDQDRRLQAGAARLPDVEGRGLGRELGSQDGLARQVDVARVLQDGARGYLAQALALEPVLRGERRRGPW